MAGCCLSRCWSGRRAAAGPAGWQSMPKTLLRRPWRSAAPAAVPQDAVPVSPAQLQRVARSHNLTDETYARIVKLLGRQPTLTEVGIFGVSWSEHCSYASSKVYLKWFPTTGPRIRVPAGAENAGAVDLG